MSDLIANSHNEGIPIGDPHAGTNKLASPNEMGTSSSVGTQPLNPALESKEPVFRRIPTSRIRPNPHQPRHFIPASVAEAMAVSLKATGQQTAAKVRPLTEAERAEDPHHDVELVGGHIRLAGALKAGLATLDCLIYDLTPEQAEIAGLLDNQSTDMFWLDWVIAIENLSLGPAKLKQQAIADKLGVSQTRVYGALKIAAALTPASRDLIYQQLVKLGSDKAPFERPVLALAGLNDPQLMEKSLPVFLNLQLTEPQAQQLVEWVKAGNPPETFTIQKTPKGKSPKTKREPGSGTKKAKSAPPLTTEVLAKVVEQTRQATLEEMRGDGQTTAQDSLKATLEAIKTQTAPTPSATAENKEPATLPTIEVLTQLAGLAEQSGMEKARGDGKTEAQEKFKAYFDELIKKHPDKNGNKKDKTEPKNNFFWEWVAGVSFINQIKSKLKKGETLSGGEKFLVGTWRFGKFLAWLAKHGIKWGGHGLKWVGHLLKKAWKALDKMLPKKGFVGKAVQVVVFLFWATILYGLVWSIGYIRQHGPVHAIGVVVSKILGGKKVIEGSVSSSPAETQSQPLVTAPAAQPIVKKAAPAKNQIKHQTQSPGPGISSPSVLAFVGNTGPQAAQTKNINSIMDELAGFPNNTVIGTFAYTPGAMNDDMSGSRIADLQDGEKYTVRLGGDKQKVTAVTLSLSKCALTLQSSLAGLGLLSNTSHLEIYWEGVKEFHVNEIHSDVNGKDPRVFYQLAMLSSDLKKSLVIQCPSAENMERLVSALEFRLKASRGSAAPIVAMPYLYQGVRLNGDGTLNTLWAGSPLDKAGLKFGDDILWSLGKDTDQPQHPKELEAALQSLTPGPHNLYKTTSVQWQRALDEVKTNSNEPFSPLREKVALTAF